MYKHSNLLLLLTGCDPITLSFSSSLFKAVSDLVFSKVTLGTLATISGFLVALAKLTVLRISGALSEGSVSLSSSDSLCVSVGFCCAWNGEFVLWFNFFEYRWADCYVLLVWYLGSLVLFYLDVKVMMRNIVDQHPITAERGKWQHRSW